MVSVAKRPGLSFSVRTLLLVMTMLCVWLGYQVNIVWQRSTLRREIEAGDGHILPWDMTRSEVMALRFPNDFVRKRMSYPEWYSYLGEAPVQRIFLNWRVHDWEYRQKIAESFPEAEVHPFRASYWYEPAVVKQPTVETGNAR